MATVIRSAPADGYDFGAKRDYRRKVWGKLLTHLPANGLIALMPSAEGAEVEYLLSKGIQADRMVLIDRNPAIAATLSRRFRPAKAYGCDAARAFSRMAEDGISLSAVNLDLCGPISPKLYACLRSLADSKVMLDMGSIAVTCMKGREHGRAWDFVQSMIGKQHLKITYQSSLVDPIKIDRCGPIRDTTMARLCCIHAMLTSLSVRNRTSGLLTPKDFMGIVVGHGEYPSGHLRMIWCAIQVHVQPCACDVCFNRWVKLNFKVNVADLSLEERVLLWWRMVDTHNQLCGPHAVLATRVNGFDQMVASRIQRV